MYQSINQIMYFSLFLAVAAAYFNESESSSEDDDYSPFEDWKKVGSYLVKADFRYSCKC